MSRGILGVRTGGSNCIGKVIVGEGTYNDTVTFKNTSSHRVPSRELRGLYLCTPNTGDAIGCSQRYHWVRTTSMSTFYNLRMRMCSAILASFLLHEELGHLGRVGCSLCLLGSLIIVLHAPPDKDVQTVDEILHFALQPGPSPSSFLTKHCAHFCRSLFQAS